LARSTQELREPDRRRSALLLAVALAGLVIIAAIAAFAGGLARGDERAVPSQGPYRGSEPPGRIHLPAFDLPSYRGGRVSAGALRGRVVLLTLLDSQCTDACPILASVIARTVDRLTAGERAQVRAVAVTGDPIEDTPASVRRFLTARRAVGRLEYLIGEERELRQLWKALHVLPSLDTGQDTLHSAPLRIYDGAGVWVATLHAGVDLTEENLLHDIRYALAARGDTSR
jgi:cytochrome oxidase Cu insertion factor (SCO1/SenC/PrrC family)